MVQMEGKYAHEKNENLDEYFKIIGVPYIPRKMMCSSSPTLEIKKDDDEWSITVNSLFRSVVSKFKLGEEYDEPMPGGVMKNTSIIEEDKLIIKSIGPNSVNMSRVYEFSNEGVIVTYKHEASGTEAKRYFKRA